MALKIFLGDKLVDEADAKISVCFTGMAFLKGFASMADGSSCISSTSTGCLRVRKRFDW